ncbi:MAG: hypothetical protein Q4F27_00215 [Desulfovibrionaceae bacterium]|nr:hypothetical protein [Desulfovibrionaceae bacterium]
MRLLRQQQAAISQTLVTARRQDRCFDLKYVGSDGSIHRMTGMMHEVRGDTVCIRIPHEVPSWNNPQVDVYFQVEMPTGIIFYKFCSALRDARQEEEGEDTLVLLDAPLNLEVGQRRSFMRVTPPPSAIRFIGIWPMVGRPAPGTIREVGTPSIFYKPGMSMKPIMVENISGTGLALRLYAPDEENPPLGIKVGFSLLCLLIYAVPDQESEKLTNFWCTCNVLNTRPLKDNPAFLAAGMEFTNWAEMEPGKPGIHWFNASPTRGVAPIIQWVMHLDREQRK